MGQQEKGRRAISSVITGKVTLPITQPGSLLPWVQVLGWGRCPVNFICDGRIQLLSCAPALVES